jgi:hypothetical protein
MKSISKKKAIEMILNSKGRYFSVEFIKKDLTARKLTGHVKKEKCITSHGYIRLKTWLTEETRMVDTRTINNLTINSQKFKVK